MTLPNKKKLNDNVSFTSWVTLKFHYLYYLLCTILSKKKRCILITDFNHTGGSFWSFPITVLHSIKFNFREQSVIVCPEDEIWWFYENLLFWLASCRAVSEHPTYPQLTTTPQTFQLPWRLNFSMFNIGTSTPRGERLEKMNFADILSSPLCNYQLLSYLKLIIILWKV